MLMMVLWASLAVSLIVSFVSAYFYWFSGNTTIKSMVGFYAGTFTSIVIFALILLIKFAAYIIALF